MLISSRHLNKKRLAPDRQGAVVGYTGKTGKTLDGRAPECHTRVLFVGCARAACRLPAAGRSRDEWFGMQLTVSSFDFHRPSGRPRRRLRHTALTPHSTRRTGRPAQCRAGQGPALFSVNMGGIPSARETAQDRLGGCAARFFHRMNVTS
ncbi:hypothetical protein PUN4_490074 [Paraburkholderia unamae]|nr:hypothetical protein PUN4_490074 [Paraburkholderia unamae]